MNSPYCGWNKNDKDDSAETGDYDFMEYNDKDKSKNGSEEWNSYKNSVQNNAKQQN
ncbi:hypothetical protein [Caproiciproducens faecalis]|uniref:Uncharacterized protein n=1 Tax=Caproiciproducens faecalis TaxID=2820301 RepID=A0ABS7DQR4_9FIRM|nr:hypothetical protein [Caproiciproducens faecalis]MBW7573630.1 hypothetical protein [Caproiciproducens faecalis]